MSSDSKHDEDIAPAPAGGRWEVSVAEARAANAEEHETTVRDALRRYPWAVMWSLIVSMSVIMEGYDTILIYNFFAYPAFKVQFGKYNEESGWQIPGEWQSALGAGPTAGAIIGAFLNGYLIKHFGYRPVFLSAMVLMAGLVFISFFGHTIELQTVGQTLCGVPWGIFATIGPAYASELLPMALRPYLTAYTNMCFAIGQFIGAGVLQSMVLRPDEWSYRIPFAIQWIWPPFLILAAFFMPESPWWLLRNERHAEAEKSLRRLLSVEGQATASRTLAMMAHTNEIESKIESGTSYRDCYRGSNIRRTEIACMAFAGQVLVGSQFAYSGTYFFEQAGLNPENSYKLGLGGTAIAFVGTIISWFLMKHFGRRSSYITGMGAMFVCLMIIGILQVPGNNGNKNVVWGQAVMCILWLFTFSLTVGPIGWTIPAEVSSTRLRSKTICLARNAYYITIVGANVLEPYMMNPTAFNWKGYTGFFWAFFALATLIWAFFRLPETKNRTFEELDIMFAAGVPTRQFKHFHVDAYAEHLDIKDRAQAFSTEKLGATA